jgi:inner membrane protein
MSDPSSILPTLQRKLKSRSMGAKLLVVCGLALVMTIPELFVSGLVEDRTERAASVLQEISNYVGGQQTFLGPTLAIPYIIPPQSAVDTAKHGVYLVFPAQAFATVKTVTQERRRSLFKVPVFQADLKLDATFDLAGVPASAPQGAEFDWSGAEIEVGIKDVRGALSDALITIGDKTTALAPAAISENIVFGEDQSQPLKLTLL